MPTITAVKPQKNKKRVNIYLDGKFGFGLDLETFVKSHLKLDQELSNEAIERIVKEGEFQTTYDKILRFASLRPRSAKEFKMWLVKHKVHESLYEELFTRLKRLELLDDKKFARWWLEQRLQFRQKSKKELVQELRIKGIDKQIIDELTGEIVSRGDQISAAKKLLEKKSYKWKALPGFERRKKIFAYLSGKGFDYELIRDIVGEMPED